MHGVILSHLKQWVGERFGAETWDLLLTRAGLEGRLYAPIKLYPDEDLDALVKTASDMTGLSSDEILVDFGAWVIPPLINMYRAIIPSHWGTVDFLLNVEDHIHEKVVKMKNPEARPPKVRVAEIEDDLLQLDYTSHRNMCALAVGCAQGVAGYYGDRVDVVEQRTLPSGSQRVILRVQRGVGRAAAGAA